MASELKVDKITGVATAGSISVTGEGNSTTTNLQQGLCKAWVKATSSAGLSDSLNIASGTDNGTGDYTYAYSNAMSNANHVVTGIGQSGSVSECSQDHPLTASFTLEIFSNGSNSDLTHGGKVVGDLA